MKITKVFEQDLKREKLKERWYWYIFFGITAAVVLVDVVLYFKYGF